MNGMGKLLYRHFGFSLSEADGTFSCRYPIGEATWEKENFMADPSQLVGTFVEAAEEEGLDLDSISDTTVLLRDAWQEDDGP